MYGSKKDGSILISSLNSFKNEMLNVNLRLDKLFVEFFVCFRKEFFPVWTTDGSHGICFQT